MVDGVKQTEINKKPNKIVKTISNLLFTIFMVIILFLIFITAQSKLTGQEPSLLGHRLYIVASGSMLPTLKINSMIIVKELLASEVEVGDMLSFYGKSTDTKITHRVVDIEESGESFITKGDANNANDSNPVEKEKVIGKVIFTIPFIGLLFRALSNPIAIIVLLIIGIAWIFIPHVLKKKE